MSLRTRSTLPNMGSMPIAATASNAARLQHVLAAGYERHQQVQDTEGWYEEYMAAKDAASGMVKAATPKFIQKKTTRLLAKISHERQVRVQEIKKALKDPATMPAGRAALQAELDAMSAAAALTGEQHY